MINKVLEGIAIIKWKYDDEGNEIEKSFYGVDGCLTPYDEDGTVKIIHIYDDWARGWLNEFRKCHLLETRYYGVDALLIGVTKYEYDDELIENIIEEFKEEK